MLIRKKINQFPTVHLKAITPNVINQKNGRTTSVYQTIRTDKNNKITNKLSNKS